MEFTTSVQTFAFIFFAGFLTSLTPCIFPMIPITLSVLGTQSLTENKAHTRWRSFFISIFYVHGIATTYSILGVAAAKSGTLFGVYLANPWVVGGIAALFVMMGLSMYGLFAIHLPHKIHNLFEVHSKKIQKNYLGAYLSGLVAGVVASPCVGPVLVALLAHVARSQNLFLGFIYLFTYAMGLGLIFVVLGTFSGFLSRIPRSGTWMNAIKFIFGSTLLLMSIYYLKPILPNPWISFYAGFIFILIYLVNTFFIKLNSSGKNNTSTKNLLQKILLLFLLIGIGLVIKGFTFHKVLDTPLTTSSLQSLQWKPYSEALVKEAKEKNKIIMVDFFADWCEACHTLEKQTFTDPQVKIILDDFTLLKVDATHETEEISKILSLYDVTGLPFILFISPEKGPLTQITLTGYEPPSAFLTRLQKVRTTSER